jgi:type I restriction enzyme S subunit
MRRVLLKEIAKIQAGNSAPGKDEFSESGIPFVRAGSLEFLTRGESIDECEKIDASLAKEKRLKLFEKGSILFAKSGMSSKLGRIYMLPKEAYVVSHLAVIKIFDDFVLEDYIKYFFQYRPPFHLIRDDAYPSIKLGDIENISIDLPDLQTQRQIVAALDKAQSIIDKRQKSVELLDELLRATFLDMFGDPALNSKNWKIDELGNQLSFLTSGSRGWAKYYSENGALFLRINNLGYNELRLEDVIRVKVPKSAEARRTKVEKGDVLLSITADLGRTAVVPDNFEKAHINQHIAILRVKNELNPYFLSEYISCNGGRHLLRKYSKGAAKSGLNFNDIRTLRIFIPPIREQEIFEKTYHQIYSLKEKLHVSLNNIKDLFQSLLQRAFHGDLTLDIDLQIDAFLDNEDLQAIEKDDVLIQLLLDRFESHNLGKVDKENSNGQSEYSYQFESLESYEKAKHALFHLLKKEKVVQQYDIENNKTNLRLS